MNMTYSCPVQFDRIKQKKAISVKNVLDKSWSFSRSNICVRAMRVDGR